MTRLKLLVLVLLAIASATTLSLWHLRAAAASNEMPPASGETSRTPVLVELFTSEGCSSCPPADSLLQKLDRSQPARNADIVVLSEHVDYWNDFEWKDPYSSRQFSVRQGDYAHRFRLEGPYTPQMVVDGDTQLVGGDEHQAIHFIESAAKVAKLPVSLSAIRLESTNTLTVHIEAGPPASLSKPTSAQVWIALADDRDQSNVRHGENAGRTLTHVAVVRNLTQVGALDHSGFFSGTARVSADNANAKNLRVIAIVQEANTGRVIGIAKDQLSDPLNSNR